MNKKRFLKRAILSLVLVLSLFMGMGCATENEDHTKEIDPYERKVNIQINLKDGRYMKAELYPDLAPITVENFMNLIKTDFYDGLIFHRCIEGFMIQGGGYAELFYSGMVKEKEATPIRGEFAANGIENGLKHTEGVLSMARTADMNSASSQFFIMDADSPSLDGQYAAFGKITEGIEVVHEIASAPTTSMEVDIIYDDMVYKDQVMSDIPKTPVIIESIEIIY